MKISAPVIALLLLLTGTAWMCPATAREEGIEAPDREALLADESNYLRQADELEERFGAGSPELDETLLGLGDVQQALAKYEDAAATFEKALQVKRTHFGLNDPAQLPLLQRLLTSLEALENWRAVDANRHLYHHIALQNYLPGDTRRLFAVEQLADWKMRNALQQLTPGYTASAAQATALYRREVDHLETAPDYPGKSNHLALLYLRQSEINFNQAIQALDASLNQFDTGTNRTTTERRCSAVPQANGTFSWVCNDVSVPNINFFLNPALRKNQVIGAHLTNMKKNIMHAYEQLQDESAPAGERDLLLGLVQELTRDYNRFVTDSSR